MPRQSAAPPWLAALPLVLLVSLLAGETLVLSLAGRRMGLGPADFLLAIATLLFPWWWRRRPPVTAATIAAYGFVIWALASATFWSVDMRRSVLSSADLMKGTLAFLICYNAFMCSKRDLFAVALRIFNLVLALQTGWVVWRAFTELGALSYFGLKDGIVTPMGLSNFIAVFFEFGIVYEVLTRRRGWLPFSLINLSALLLTLSRGALAALAMTLIVGAALAALLPGQRKASLALLGVLAAAVVGLVATPLGQFIIEAFGTVSRSATARMALWQSALEAASHAPLTGVGFGTFESVGENRHTHSLPFELLSGTGVFGFGLFVFAMAAIVVKAFAEALNEHRTREDRRENLALALALFGILSHSLIEPFFLGRSAIWTGIVLAWMVVVSSGGRNRATATAVSSV